MNHTGWLLLAIISAAIFGFAMFEIGKRQNENRPANANNYSDTEINKSHQEHACERTNKEEAGVTDPLGSAEKHSGLFLVIVTGLLVLVTGFLWLATRALVKGADQTARLDQRAWVGVTEMRTSQPKVGEIYTPLIILKNSGKTFAKKVRYAAQWELIPKGGEPDFTKEDRKLRENADKGGFIIAPDAGHNLSDTTTVDTITESEVRDYESGKLQLFVWGKITYEDIFKRPHWTTFCGVLKPGASGYSAVGNHNDADDD